MIETGFATTGTLDTAAAAAAVNVPAEKTGGTYIAMICVAAIGILAAVALIVYVRKRNQETS